MSRDPLHGGLHAISSWASKRIEFSSGLLVGSSSQLMFEPPPQDCDTVTSFLEADILSLGYRTRFVTGPYNYFYQATAFKHIFCDLIYPAASAQVYSAIKQVCERLMGSEQHLNELDTQSGDGDCGSTVARGAKGELSNRCVNASWVVNNISIN